MYELRVAWEKDGEKIYRFSTEAEARAFRYGITEEVAKNKDRTLPQIIISKKTDVKPESDQKYGFIAALTSLLISFFTCIWWYAITRSEIFIEYAFISVITMLVSYLGFLIWWLVKKRQ
jgi:hypothetical protein